MTAASALFHVDSPRFAGYLRERLAKRVLELNDQLLLSADWADFRNRAGKIAGIGEAITMLDEIENNERN